VIDEKKRYGDYMQGKSKILEELNHQ